MEIFYFLALLPIGLGLIAKYVFHKNISWQEWIIATVLAFITAGISHAVVNTISVSDFEVISGRVIYVKHYTRWKEYYEEAIYRTDTYTDTESYTDANGKSQTRTVTRTEVVFDHWEPRTRWHDDWYEAVTTIKSSYRISSGFYYQLVAEYGNEEKVEGDRTTGEHASRMIDGDRYDRISQANNIITPVHGKQDVANRLLRADKNVYSFVEIPENIKVMDYPDVKDPFCSKRLINVDTIPIKDWDILNAKVGPTKKVNLILINFDVDNPPDFNYIRSKWVGGKKNDLVLCKGKDWAKVFGWSDAEICKRDLETILLKNKLDKNILPLIEKEVMENYEKTNWHKFDHIAIEPSTTSVVVYIIIMLALQGGIYYWLHQSEVDIIPVINDIISEIIYKVKSFFNK